MSLRECKYLDNPHQRNDQNFRPIMKTGYIMEETKTGFLIATGGIVNRNKKDVVV